MTLSEWPSLTVQVASERPRALSTLQEFKEECRVGLRFVEAQTAQSQVELIKYQEEHRRMQALWELHMEQQQNLKDEQEEDLNAFLAKWNSDMDDIRVRGKAQIAAMDKRHAEEMADHRSKVSMPKPRWSPLLLNIHRSRDALGLQSEFAKAEQLHEWAAKLEREETEMHVRQWQLKAGLDESKVRDRQAREGEALMAKLVAGENESVLNHERQLDKLLKKHQAAEAALSGVQSLELAELTQALKGWMNPRRAGVRSTPTSPCSTSAPNSPYSTRSPSSSINNKALSPTLPGRLFRSSGSQDVKRVPEASSRSATTSSQSAGTIYDDSSRAHEWLCTLTPDSAGDVYEASSIMNPLLPKPGGFRVKDMSRGGASRGSPARQQQHHHNRSADHSPSASMTSASFADLGLGTAPAFKPAPESSQYCLTSVPLPVLPTGANGKPPAVMGFPYATAGGGPGSAALRSAARDAAAAAAGAAPPRAAAQPLSPFGRHTLHA